MFPLSREKLFLRNYNVFYNHCSIVSRVLPRFSVNVLISTNDGIRKDRLQLKKKLEQLRHLEYFSYIFPCYVHFARFWIL